MKKVTVLLPPALALIFAIGAVFSSNAYKKTDSYLLNVKYDTGSSCATCVLNDPGTGFECSTTQNLNDPRCTCRASQVNHNATDPNDASSPCDALWKNTINP